jgi:hypothetical protein
MKTIRKERAAKPNKDAMILELQDKYERLDAICKSAFEENRQLKSKLNERSLELQADINFIEQTVRQCYGTTLMIIKNIKGGITNGN